MQSPHNDKSQQSFDIQEAVRNIVGGQSLPTIPSWEHIPEIMVMTQDTLRYHRASLYDILAILEAVNLSLRLKVNTHMLDWDSPDIRRYGTKLALLESYIENTGNALIRDNDAQTCLNNLLATFKMIREIWNDLYAQGCI